MNEFMVREYIELCKNKNIQGLRPNKINLYDWVSTEKGIGICSGFTSDLFCISSVYIQEHFLRKDLIWLPQSGDLENEIAKICNEKEYYYTLSYSFAENQYLWTAIISPENKSTIITNNNNPLVAKILLLIKLLEEG